MTEGLTPRNPEQQFLQGICDRLDRNNELLADLCDRLPAPSGQPAADQSTAQEPRKADGEVVELREPDAPSPVPAKEPAKTPDENKPADHKPAEKKPAAAKNTTTTRATSSSTRARRSAPKKEQS